MVMLDADTLHVWSSTSDSVPQAGSLLLSAASASLISPQKREKFSAGRLGPGPNASLALPAQVFNVDGARWIVAGCTRGESGCYKQEGSFPRKFERSRTRCATPCSNAPVAIANSRAWSHGTEVRRCGQANVRAITTAVTRLSLLLVLCF